MIVTNEEELLAELKRQEVLYGRLAELYHWAAMFWLAASIWFLGAAAVILLGNTRMGVAFWISGAVFAVIGQLIGWCANRIERKEGLK